MGMQDRGEREDDWQLRDAELALLDINKMLIEILLSAKIAKVADIEHLMIELVAKYDKEKMPSAFVVIDLLRKFLRDPARAELRERLGSRLLAQRQDLPGS